MNNYILKACRRCGGDLAMDDGDWICLQCGVYYYVGLYQAAEVPQAPATEGQTTEAQANCGKPAPLSVLPTTPTRYGGKGQGCAPRRTLSLQPTGPAASVGVPAPNVAMAGVAITGVAMSGVAAAHTPTPALVGTTAAGSPC